MEMLLLGTFYWVLSLCFGFIAASILKKVFRDVLRFRVDWTSTFISSMLTCLVSAVALTCSMISYDFTAEHWGWKVLGTTFAFAFFAGWPAFRLIIKTSSGRSLGWFVSGVASFSISVPPLVLVSLVSLMVEEF